MHLTVFGPDLNEDIGQFGYGVRLYGNPINSRFSMVHVGVSAVREEMDRDARFWARPETRVTNIRLVDTDRNDDVDSQSIYGVELAVAQNSWSVRGEYLRAEWDRKVDEDPKFNGFYIQANWAITGESFQYRQGKFIRIRPSNKKRGAWEVALRYSSVNLTDLDVLGGQENNATLALNWYGPGNQVRIQSNVIYVDTDNLAGREKLIIAQIRLQVHW